MSRQKITITARPSNIRVFMVGPYRPPQISRTALHSPTHSQRLHAIQNGRLGVCNAEHPRLPSLQRLDNARSHPFPSPDFRRAMQFPLCLMGRPQPHTNGPSIPASVACFLHLTAVLSATPANLANLERDRPRHRSLHGPRSIASQRNRSLMRVKKKIAIVLGIPTDIQKKM